MSWADATANPANKAAVLTNSCFLMEWSSSFSRFPCGPMRVDSEDNDVTRAQFRPRAPGSLRLLAAWFGRFCGTKFLREIFGKSARWCSAKSLGDFTLGIIDRHARSVGAPRTKERAQRRCRTLSLGAGGIGSPLSRGCKLLPLQQNLNLAAADKFQYASRDESPRWPNGGATWCGLRDFKRAKPKLPG
jgi:hypothetical protein